MQASSAISTAEGGLERCRSCERNGFVETKWPRLVQVAVDIFCCLGFRDGVHFSSSCTFCRRCVVGHPPTLQTRIKMMQDLTLGITWLEAETILEKISGKIYKGTPCPVRATVGAYFAALHSLGVIPHLGVELIEAVQLYLRELHRPNCCCLDRVWTLYTLAKNDDHFVDFAVRFSCHQPRDVDLDIAKLIRRKVPFLGLCESMWQCAVDLLDECHVCRGVDSMEQQLQQLQQQLCSDEQHVLDKDSKELEEKG